MKENLLKRVINLFQAPFHYDELEGVMYDAKERIVLYSGEWREVQGEREVYTKFGDMIIELLNRRWEEINKSDFRKNCQEELQKKLDVKVENLGFSNIALKSCKKVGAKCANDLVCKSPPELKSDGFNQNSVMEVELALEDIGLYMGVGLSLENPDLYMDMNLSQ